MNKPTVSVLIAARNEEENILDLLRSIDALDFPKNELQVLIGNDDSSDRTAEIVQEFISQKPYYQLITIQETIENLKGKANVLATLAHFAKGDIYLYTDADIELPKTWVTEMLKSFGEQSAEKSKVGVVTGATVVDCSHGGGNIVFKACQAIEWLGALQIMKILEKYKLPVTGMGNNMGVSAEAYWAVGGYEKIGFSIVEDYAIFRAIVDKGFEFRQLFNPQILAKTKAPKDFKSYFYQRKRWMAGGFESKSILIIPAIIQALFLPILLIIGCFSWKLAFTLWGIKAISHAIFSIQLLKIVHQKKLIKYLPAFELYMLIFPLCQIVFYFIPIKTIWKDRKY